MFNTVRNLSWTYQPHSNSNVHLNIHQYPRWSNLVYWEVSCYQSETKLQHAVHCSCPLSLSSVNPLGPDQLHLFTQRQQWYTRRQKGYLEQMTWSCQVTCQRQHMLWFSPLCPDSPFCAILQCFTILTTQISSYLCCYVNTIWWISELNLGNMTGNIHTVTTLALVASTRQD